MEYTATPTSVSAAFCGGRLVVTFPQSGGVRLQYGPGVPLPAWCPVLQKEPELLPCCCEAQGEELWVTASGLTLRLGADGSLCALQSDQALWSAPGPAFAWQPPWARLRFACKAEERIYGLGQDPAARLDHNHQERRMWNQWGGHERSGNSGVGFFASTGGYGLLLATPAAARFCFNKSEPQPLDPLGEAMVPSPWEGPLAQPEATACVEAAEGLDVFLLLGQLPALLQGYHALTGLPRLMPKWAYGFLQCKNRYMNRQDLLHTARRLRAENVPCDGLIIDWLWFSEFGDLEWREDDWPQAGEMLAQLAQMGFAVASAQHPFVSENGKYYGAYCQKGYLNQVPPTKRVTYDHTNPAAREAWWQKTAALYRQGLRGYWTDMGELEEHFEGTQSAAGGRLKTHNAYTLLWSQGLYEGQRRDFGTRAFILARAACAGLQKYGAAVWSGDVNATWQVLRDQVVLGQGMALSGIPWWGTDIGGFLSGEECTPELYVRWLEWGVFCGLFRTHGTRPGNEPWSFGEEAGEHIRALIRLRYTLLPYIYSLAMACALQGEPLVRPMGYSFPQDQQAAACEGQFLLGPALLLAPVTQPGARSARVYLPQGEWYHWWSGKKLGAGWHTLPAPLGQPPLFVRAGTVLPTYATIGKNTAECSGLCLLTFPGAEGTFDYYNDDGLSYGYEVGEYTHVRFAHKNGGVEAQALRGEVPPFTVKPFAPAAVCSFAVDCAWGGENAAVTLTCLQEGKFKLSLQPQQGWYVTGCTAGGCAKELYEETYRTLWEGELCLKAGQTLCWQLLHCAPWRQVGVQQATLLVKAGNDAPQRLCARWGGPYLAAPQLLGCLPAGAAAQGFAPEKQPNALAYEYAGRTWHWLRDPLFANNSFGYVDFRRLGPERRGEAMLGEAWAKETLYSKVAQNAEFELRYDSPLTLWLNGELVFQGSEKNACGIPLQLALAAGENQLLVRQIAAIPRPYSGGEFGYSLRLVGALKIYTLK